MNTQAILLVIAMAAMAAIGFGLIVLHLVEARATRLEEIMKDRQKNHHTG